MLLTMLKLPKRYLFRNIVSVRKLKIFYAPLTRTIASLSFCYSNDKNLKVELDEEINETKDSSLWKLFSLDSSYFSTKCTKNTLDGNLKKSGLENLYEKVKSCCTESGEHGMLETICVYTFTFGVLLILLTGDVKQKNKVNKFVLKVSACITLFSCLLYAFAKQYPYDL